jgi:predicted secreted protein
MMIENRLRFRKPSPGDFSMKCLLLLLAVAASSAGTPSTQTSDPAAPAAKKDDKAMRLTDADNKKTAKAVVGTAFDIALKGNATTGYQWQVGKIEGDAIRQKGKVDYVPDKHAERMVGYGGTFIFHFKVKKDAPTKIRLVYVRPWEKDKSPEKVFEVVINPPPAKEDAPPAATR